MDENTKQSCARFLGLMPHANDDQLFGALMRRAKELNLMPEVIGDYVRLHDGDTVLVGYNPVYVEAAAEAVEKYLLSK